MLRSKIRRTASSTRSSGTDEPFFRHDVLAEHDLDLTIGVRKELMQQLLELASVEVRVVGRAQLDLCAEERRVFFYVGQALFDGLHCAHPVTPKCIFRSVRPKWNSR